MCDVCFHRVLLPPAAVDTNIADAAAAFKALEYIIIIIIIINIIIILLIRRGDVEPPNLSLRVLDSTVAQGGSVPDHLSAVVYSHCTCDNVNAFSQKLYSFLRGHRRIV